MLRQLIGKYGKDKINSMTKYPSILTLHKVADRGKLIEELATPSIANILTNPKDFYATEKVNGTNVRIVCLGDEYLIGSREEILHYDRDLYYDCAQEIVDAIREIEVVPPITKEIVVIYGELYGDRKPYKSTSYGTGSSFRMFDICVFDIDNAVKLMQLSTREIASWREHETDTGIIYGQPFLSRSEMLKYETDKIKVVPIVDLSLNSLSMSEVYQSLKTSLPQTNVGINNNGKAEGLVVRSNDRSLIAKIRFEDYERTFR